MVAMGIEWIDTEPRMLGALGQDLPAYDVVITADGAELFSGQLDVETIMRSVQRLEQSEEGPVQVVFRAYGVPEQEALGEEGLTFNVTQERVDEMRRLFAAAREPEDGGSNGAKKSSSGGGWIIAAAVAGGIALWVWG